MTAPDVNADVRARFEEPLDVRRKVLVDSLRASKGWMTGYAEAFVDTYVDDAHADLAREVRELVEAASDGHETPTAHIKPQVGLYFNPAKAERLRAALAKFHPTHQEKP